MHSENDYMRKLYFFGTKWENSTITWILELISNRDHFVYAPNQWETTLQCNVSYWLSVFTKWSLLLEMLQSSYKHMSRCLIIIKYVEGYELHTNQYQYHVTTKHGMPPYKNKQSKSVQKQCKKTFLRTLKLWHGWVIAYHRKMWHVINYPCHNFWLPVCSWC